MKLEVGSLFVERFRVLRAIEAPHSAYLVEDRAMHRQRRLDLFDPLEDAPARTRFPIEAFRELEAPHVCEVVDAAVTESGVPYVLSQYVGEPLAVLLERGPLELPAADAILRALSAALAVAHSKGIVHRALSPYAIDVAEDGQSAVRFLPRTANEVPTPAYAAPEQLDARPVATPAIDVWALGLVAYEMLAGQRYFLAESEQVLLRAILVDPLPSASERAPQLPSGFDAWFARCVSRDPAGRYRDAAEAYDAFRALVIRDRILERRRQYVESALGEESFGTYRAPPESVGAMPCLMIVTADMRRREERATSMQWIVIALALCAAIGIAVAAFVLLR